MAAGGGGGDHFGLSLVDMKLDDQAELDPAAYDGYLGGDLEGLRALMGAGFTLNLSGKGTPAKGVIQASTITVTAGANTDVGAIKFQLADAAAATVRIVEAEDPTPDDPVDYVYGVISADLETENHYTIPGVAEGEKLQIHLEARYGARRGFMSCMR